MPTACLWLLALSDLDGKIVYSTKFTVIFKNWPRMPFDSRITAFRAPTTAPVYPLTPSTIVPTLVVKYLLSVQSKYHANDETTVYKEIIIATATMGKPQTFTM